MFLIQAIEVVNLAADKKIWLFKQCITLMKCLCIQFEREFKKKGMCHQCSAWTAPLYTNIDQTLVNSLHRLLNC